VVHDATVTDTDGNIIDTTEFFGPSGEQAAAAAAVAAEEAADDTASDEVSADAK
jgi:trigger factor